MKVAFIIVTYNGSKWVDRCFGSCKSEKHDVSVFAYDNGSSDNTVALIKEGFPSVELVETGANLGFGKANNLGLKRALHEGFDYVYLLNQDAWLEEGSLDTLIAAHADNEECGILSPMQFNGKGVELDKKFDSYLDERRAPGFRQAYENNELLPLYKVQFVNAAGWLISRRCLETIGGFDPIFPHYGEDNDYTARVQFHGFDIGLVTSAKMCHDRPQTIVFDFDSEKFRKKVVLSRCKNMRGQFGSNFRKQLKWEIKKLLKSVFSLKMTSVSLNLSMINFLFSMRPAIKNSRELSKQKGATFL